MENEKSEFAKRLDSLSREIDPALWLEHASRDLQAWSDTVSLLKDQGFQVKHVAPSQHKDAQLILSADDGWGSRAIGLYTVSRRKLTFTPIQRNSTQPRDSIELVTESAFENHLFSLVEAMIRGR